MKRDPLQTQKEELVDFQRKYREADPADYRKEIYKKKIVITKNKIDCTLIRKRNTKGKILDFHNYSRIYGYR